jgi:hypothetical protein
MSTAVLPMEGPEMNVVAMQPGAERSTVEVLLGRIHTLARERQELRVRQAGPGRLERNRIALVRSQWELSYALIEQHLQPERQAA